MGAAGSMQDDSKPPGEGPVRASRELERLADDGAASTELRDLRERMKELRCLYTASKALFRAADLDSALRTVVEAIPAGWQYPHIAVARLHLPDLELTTPSFRDCDDRMIEPVGVDGAEEGWLEVAYLEDRPAEDEGPFLEGERMLLRALAERIGETVARHRTEDRLRRRESHFRLLVESAADLIAVVDARTVVRYANPSAPAVCGYAPEELVGMRGADLVHPDDHATVDREFFGKLTDPGAVVRMELRIRHKEGGWRHLDALGRNLTHEPGVGGILVVARDISERKRLEEELRQAQKMEAVGRLAGGIAHDFNNLLSVIDVQAELLADDLPAGDPRREDVEEIRRASRHGSSLTRQLLAFSRRQVAKIQDVFPSRLIADTERMLRRLLGEDVTLETDLRPDAGIVRMDPGQLEQVLLNLTVNARDAMPRGGRLEVATRGVEVGAGDAELSPGSYVEIAVSDTGQGMSPEVIDHVFEPFFTTKSGGTGLGLSTVYGIVRQHGGSLHVESEVGRGSTFIVRLPRAAGEGAAARPRDSIPARVPGGSETILLVEDDDRLRRATRRVLRRQGYHVLVARGGAEALALARDHQGAIDLLLTDVVMPDMSGPELAKALAGERPGVAVLLASGYTAGVEVGRQATIDPDVPFLEKPFTPAGLARMVREALAMGSP